MENFINKKFPVFSVQVSVLEKSLCFCLLAVMFCFFTTPIEDGDLFWHLKTGEWIWQNRTLPVQDLFSYTVSDINPFRPGSGRVRFILQQYWLGQVCLFLVWKALGYTGIILLRAATYTTILAIIFFWMRRKGGGAAPLLFSFLTGTILLTFPSERPQLFTFLFMPVCLYLLERVRSDDRIVPAGALLPLLMLVWANMHGGYILGVVLISFYLLFEFLGFAGKKRQKPGWPRVAVLLLALAAAGANPCGYDAFREAVGTLPAYSSVVQENASPFTAAIRYHFYYPGYWLFLAIATGVTVWRCKEFPPVHLLIILFLAVLSLTSSRYMPFLLMTAPLLAGHVREPGARHKWVIVAVLLAVWAVTVKPKRLFNFGPIHFFPDKAVRFLQENRPAPQLFNFYYWGGYLIWNLPEYKVFVDGRALVEEVVVVYNKALYTDEWRTVLDANGVNTVLLPAVDMMNGSLFPLALNLLRDNEWKLVYNNYLSMVFVRDIASNAQIIRSHSINKSEVFQALLQYGATRQ